MIAYDTQPVPCPVALVEALDQEAGEVWAGKAEAAFQLPAIFDLTAEARFVFSRAIYPATGTAVLLPQIGPADGAVDAAGSD